MNRIQLNKVRTFSVILIIVSNWNEIVLSSYHNNNNNDHSIDNVKMSSVNRLRHHHNIHHNHHHHHHQNSEKFQQQLNHHQHSHHNSRQLNLHRSREYDNRTWKSFYNHRKNSLALKYNKIDEAVHAFRSSSTTSRPLNYHQHNWHHYRSVDTKKYHHQIEQLEEINDRGIVSTNMDNEKRLTMLKVNNSNFQSLPWLKTDLKNNSSSMLQNYRTTISPFHSKVTNISARNIEIAATSGRKIVKTKNDNSRGVHRNDDDDYYYYDDDDDDDDDEEEENVDDEDVYMNNFDVTFQKRNNRGTNNKFLDRLTDDYQFDEPINRISTEKSETLTEQKWRELGTAEAVEISRRKSLNETQLVSAHITRVHLEAMCKYPRPKIIQINEASKRYVPHCTILYRCGDDTGCCHSDTHKCVAKKTTTVDLYFYAIPLGMKDPVVETLSFINHTECHCVEKYKSSKVNKNHMLSTSVLDQQGNQLLSDNKDDNNENNSSKKVSSTFCRCTRYFDIFEEDIDDNTDYQNDEPITESRKKCRCDCVTNNTVCQRLKKGQEGFLYEEQRCIVDEKCTIPTCDFGDYTINTGRCPRGKEKRTIHRRNYNYFN